MKTFITFGLGALTMYLLDPEHGARRRAQLREQWARARRALPETPSRTLPTNLEPDTPADTPPSAHHLGR